MGIDFFPRFFSKKKISGLVYKCYLQYVPMLTPHEGGPLCSRATAGDIQLNIDVQDNWKLAFQICEENPVKINVLALWE